MLASSQLLTAPTGAAQRTDPVVLDASATSVPYAKQLVLTATVAPQPDAQVSFYAKALGGPDKLLGTATTGGDGKAKVTLPVTRTATYYAVLLVGGVSTAESAPVNVVVAPALKLTAVRVIGPVYHFNAKVVPAADGIPIVLQRLVGKRWKKVEKDLTEGGELDLQRRDSVPTSPRSGGCSSEAPRSTASRPRRSCGRRTVAAHSSLTTTSSWTAPFAAVDHLDGPAQVAQGLGQAGRGARVRAVLEQRADDPALGRLVEVADHLAPAGDLVQHPDRGDARQRRPAARTRRTSRCAGRRGARRRRAR